MSCCLYYVVLFYVVLFYIFFFHACPNIGKLSNSVRYDASMQLKTKTFFSFQFDKKAMIVKFEELDDERQKEAKLVR